MVPHAGVSRIGSPTGQQERALFTGADVIKEYGFGHQIQFRVDPHFGQLPGNRFCNFEIVDVAVVGAAQRHAEIGRARFGQQAARGLHIEGEALVYILPILIK